MDSKFDRTKGLGGSDIPVLLRLSKWKTPLDLYLEKIGESAENTIKENQKHILAMGKTLEPYVIQSFEEDTGEKVIRQQERILHPKYDFLWGTIDGMCSDMVIEIKTTSSYVDGWKEGVPQYVLAQAAYYANLLNSKGAKIVVLFRDTGEIRTYAYERDVASEEQIITCAVNFWDSVCKRIPPEPTSYEEAQTIFKNVISDKKVIASTQDIAAIERMRQLKKELEEKEKEYDALKTNICAKLGDAPVLEDAEGHCLATWKERNSTRVSIDTLKSLHPAIYGECLLKSTVRNFSLKAYA